MLPTLPRFTSLQRNYKPPVMSISGRKPGLVSVSLKIWMLPSKKYSKTQSWKLLKFAEAMKFSSAVDFAVPVKELSRVQQSSNFSLTHLLLGLFWIYNACSVFKRLTTTLWSFKNASELKIYQKRSNFNSAVDFTVPVKEVVRAQHCSFFSMTD